METATTLDDEYRVRQSLSGQMVDALNAALERKGRLERMTPVARQPQRVGPLWVLLTPLEVEGLRAQGLLDCAE